MIFSEPRVHVMGRLEIEALDHAGEHADSIVEALAVSDPPFPAAPLLDEDEVL